MLIIKFKYSAAIPEVLAVSQMVRMRLAHPK